MHRSSPIPARHPHTTGLTLVELLVAVVVLAVLVTATLPSLVEALDRRRLVAVAADTGTLLQSARTAALARGEPLRVTLLAGAAGQCLLLHAGPASGCSCPAPTGRPLPQCSDDAALVLAQAVSTTDRVGLALGAPGLRHDPATGTTTPTATVRVTGRTGSVHHAVNLMGRVRSCATPAGLGGHPPC
jgi:type IV fimbrial biogenesis protein FimT